MANLNTYLSDPASVQVRYRPILQEDVPPVPEPGDTTSHSARFWAREFVRSRFDGWTAEDGTYFNPMAYWIFNHTAIEQVDEFTGRAFTGAPLYSTTTHELYNQIWACRASQAPEWGTDSDVVKPWRGRRKKAGYDDAAIQQREKSYDRFINAQDLIFTKGRRKGFTFAVLGGVFPWKFCVEQNGHLGAGFDSRETREEGQRVFRMSYDNLHPFWKHPSSESYKEGLFHDREGRLSAAVLNNDGSGYKEGRFVQFKEMDRRTGAFRGKNFNMVLFDEAGKYTRLNQIVGATADCLRQGVRKYGSMIIGGTCDSATNKNEDYEVMWRKAAELGWRKVFIPAWQLARPYVNWYTGESMEQPARAAYQAERQKLLDAGAMESFYMNVQENPLEEEELFMLPSLSVYPSEKLMGQTLNIAALGEAQKYVTGRLEWQFNAKSRSTGVASFIEDPTGMWHFLRSYEVRKDLVDLDVAGVDDVYKDEAPHSDSKCAVVLYRRFHHRLDESDMPVAYFFGRPLMDIFADEVHKLMAFTGCRTILEHNAPHLSKHLQKEGLGERLLWYNGEPGLRNSEQSIAQQTMLALKWIREGGLGRCWFQAIVDALKKWRHKKVGSERITNTDIGSAFHLCMTGVDTLNDRAIEDETEGEVIPIFRFGQAGALPMAFAGDMEGDDWVPLFGTGCSAWGR